jgi:aspartate-semialdehyde dehydrogenase
VGAETLLARELREALAERPRSPRLELISALEQSSLLTEDDGEPALLRALTAESLEGCAGAFLAGSPASARRAHRLAKPGAPLLIDLTGALEDQPNARLRAPLVEPEPVALSPELIHVIAHPAAIALALFLGKLDAAALLRRVLVHVFEPASERGQRGMDELQQQSVALLSFQTLEREVYDTQVAFSMLPRCGEEAREPLADIELRIDRHLATLLGPWPRVPMPSLRVLQAPVFHGYTFSVWAEFEENPGPEKLAAAFASAAIEVRGAGEEPASNTGAAGQDGLTVSDIAVDRNNPRAAWFFLAADNLRLAAVSALAAAERLLES